MSVQPIHQQCVYRGLAAIARNTFITDICPSGRLVEIYRWGPNNWYAGWVCASQITPQ